MSEKLSIETTAAETTRNELASAALANYDELQDKAWPAAHFLSTIPQAIEAWRTLPALEAENAELKRRAEHLKNAIRNTVRHFREDNCTEVARCPYLDAAESAIHD